eukprot:maker-scaffold_12-snap-gene-2.2-mRNA-1 protein AED:0.10 eAED:0.10 QI:372/0.5/0.33/1/0/0.33/3/0/529
MNWIYMMTQLALLPLVVHSSAQIPLVTGDFTFLTPRYSNYIGGFEKDCSITAPMVKLSEEENLCEFDTIKTNIVGKVLVTFVILNYGCYEEVAYENAIKLGAIALIDAVFMPAGSFHSVHNTGQSFQYGDIPFLQIGSEFFAVFESVDSNFGSELSNDTQIIIEGCADKTPLLECYDVYQAVVLVFAFVAFFGVFLAIKAVRKLKITPSIRPRVALLIYEAIFLFFYGVLLFFGLTLRQARNLLDGRVVSAQVKDILGILQIVGVIQGSLMNAIYWNALRKGCFLKEAITPEYWNKNFFFSPWQFVALIISIIFFVECVNLMISKFFFVLLHGLIRIFHNRRNQEVFSEEENCLKKFNSFWKSVKGAMKTNKIILQKDEHNNCEVSEVHAKLVNLSLHLSKWLTLYVIILIICSCLILFGLTLHLPFEIAQDDPKGCKAFSFYFSYICIRVFTSYCKIIGLEGPSKNKVLEAEDEAKSFAIDENTNNRPGNDNLSSISETLQTHYLTESISHQNVYCNRQERNDEECSL